MSGVEVLSYAGGLGLKLSGIAGAEVITFTKVIPAFKHYQ
jgi:hypothetical protein